MEREARTAGREPPLPPDVAAQLVEQLSADSRARAELVPHAIAGPAAWWERRPALYRR